MPPTLNWVSYSQRHSFRRFGMMPPSDRLRPKCSRSVLDCLHVRRCDGCHLLAAVLAELGLRCVALHSHKSQKRRLAALHTFRAGEHLARKPAGRGLEHRCISSGMGISRSSLSQ